MNYMLGCNYWESKQGIDMWKNFDAKTVDADFRELSSVGVKYIRMFPNWREFQPACAVCGHSNTFDEYRDANDDKFDNEFLIDKNQIANFKTVCSIAEKYNIKLIVAVLTGWMSGRLYTPPAIVGRDLYTDPEALQMEIRFVRGFVRYMKDEKAIVAWDLGNEANNLSPKKNNWVGYYWTALIANTIRSEDNTRKIQSGMHGLAVQNGDSWTISDQGENTDVMCVHPYPSPSVSADGRPVDTPLVTMTPSAQLQFYAGIGGKPCCIQETGTFSSFVGNDEQAAKNARVNIYSGFANGSVGYLWWCGFDQEHLRKPPYGKHFCENELGLIRSNREPKPVALALKKAGEVLESMPFIDDLPAKELDAVLIASRDQEHFKVARTSYILAKQAGFEFSNISYKQDIPKAKLYMVPCERSIFSGMGVDVYYELLDRVSKDGSTLYISNNDGHVINCEKFLGVRSFGRFRGAPDRKLSYADGSVELPFFYGVKTKLEATAATVLATDESGDPVFTVYNYGKGKVYYLGFPLETMLYGDNGRFIDNRTPYYEIYKTIASDIIENKIIVANEQNVGVTIHHVDDSTAYALAINYGEYDVSPNLKIKDGWKISELYGEKEVIPSCDMAVYKLTRV